MEPDRFFAAVKTMRSYQREYFKSRDTTVLRLAKEWERKVDALLEEAENADKPKQGELL